MSEQRKIVTAAPENSETPLEAIQSWVTPTRLFFVRNHFDAPSIDMASWRLSVEGCVARPISLTLDDLNAMPQRTVAATVECAGNGRSFLLERQTGVQWGAGAIGHAEWTGVPVHLLLERAGLRPDAVEIVFEGADSGTEADHPLKMQFARGLPLRKALHPSTLLATRMNGETIDPNHGFPVRLFVPGWYGVASVKWLRRIIVLNKPFDGYFQTVKYTTRRQMPGGLETVIIGPMVVKSEILRPVSGAALSMGMNRIFGVAWAGEEAVATVDVSTDGGQTWAAATLMGPRAAYSWTMWEYQWAPAAPGSYSLLARATSTAADVQPDAHDPLNAGYLIHHPRPTQVLVQPVALADAVAPPEEAIQYDMAAFAEENARFPLDVQLEFADGEGI